MGLDNAAFGQRIFRPDRPRLAEARAAVEGIADSREAWEALAARGVIPMDWVGDPRRGFVQRDCDCCGGRRCAVAHPEDYEDDYDPRHTCRCPGCDGWGELYGDTPATLATCIALAADPGGVLRAEAIAHEHVRELAPHLQPSRVVWKTWPENAAMADCRRFLDEAYQRAGWPRDDPRGAVLETGYDLRSWGREIVLVAVEVTDDA